MNQQQYRLLCMDIDGTLLNSAHKLPLANREAVQSAAKNGVTICLMSARPPRAVFPIRDALGVDGPLVCCGGGLILADEKRLADSRLTRACAQAVLQETQARGIHLSVYRDLDWLISAKDEWSRAGGADNRRTATVAPAGDAVCRTGATQARTNCSAWARNRRLTKCFRYWRQSTCR